MRLIKNLIKGILILATVGLGVYASYYMSNRITLEKNEIVNEPTIMINDDINIIIGTKYQLSPYLIDELGNIIDGSYSYLSMSDAIEVDEDGVISANSKVDEAKVLIAEDNYDIEKEINVSVIEGIDEVLDVSYSFNKLLINDELNEINIKTYPENINLNGYVSLSLFDNNGKDISSALDYKIDKNTIYFKVLGIGNCKLKLDITDKRLGLLLSYDREFKSTLRNLALSDSLAKNEFIANSDLAKIDKLYYKGASLDLKDLDDKHLNIKDIYIENENIELINLNQRYTYYVPVSLAKRIYESPLYKSFYKYIRPYDPNDLEARYIVFYDSFFDKLEIKNLADLVELPAYDYYGYSCVDLNDKFNPSNRIKSIDDIKANEDIFFIENNLEPIKYDIKFKLNDQEIIKKATYNEPFIIPSLPEYNPEAGYSLDYFKDINDNKYYPGEVYINLNNLNTLVLTPVVSENSYKIAFNVIADNNKQIFKDYALVKYKEEIKFHIGGNPSGDYKFIDLAVPGYEFNKATFSDGKPLDTTDSYSRLSAINMGKVVIDIYVSEKQYNIIYTNIQEKGGNLKSETVANIKFTKDFGLYKQNDSIRPKEFASNEWQVRRGDISITVFDSINDSTVSLDLLDSRLRAKGYTIDYFMAGSTISLYYLGVERSYKITSGNRFFSIEGSKASLLDGCQTRKGSTIKINYNPVLGYNLTSIEIQVYVKNLEPISYIINDLAGYIEFTNVKFIAHRNKGITEEHEIPNGAKVNILGSITKKSYLFKYSLTGACLENGRLDEEEYVSYGAMPKLKALEYKGYDFSGIFNNDNIKPSDIFNHYSNIDEFTNEIIFEGHYTHRKIKVSFDHETTNGMSIENHYYGDSLPKGRPITGKIFQYWIINDNGKRRIDSIDKDFKKGISLTAVYEDRERVIVDLKDCWDGNLTLITTDLESKQKTTYTFDNDSKAANQHLIKMNDTVIFDKSHEEYNSVYDHTLYVYKGDYLEYNITLKHKNKHISKLKSGKYYSEEPSGSLTITENLVFHIDSDWDKPKDSGGPCFIQGTKVLMADGSYKLIENIMAGDYIMSYSFFTGKYEATPVSVKWNHEAALIDVIKLKFDNGIEVEIAGMHNLFNYDLLEYTLITGENAKKYIGTRFVVMDGMNEATAKLVSVDVKREYARAYSLISYKNFNAITNNLLSLTYEMYDGALGLALKVNKDLKYDDEELNYYIDKYGLYSYSDWKDYLTEDEFEAFNGYYFKLLVGRGILTKDNIIDLINELLQNDVELVE